MNTGKLFIQGMYLERIDKRTARKEFNKGTQLLIIPCKANPYHGLWRYSQYNKSMVIPASFDGLCAMISYYNCNRECGMYLSYYIVEERKECKQ